MTTRNKTRRQTMINKILHRKVKIIQHEPHYKKQKQKQKPGANFFFEYRIDAINVMQKLLFLKSFFFVMSSIFDKKLFDLCKL